MINDIVIGGNDATKLFDLFFQQPLNKIDAPKDKTYSVRYMFLCSKLHTVVECIDFCLLVENIIEINTLLPLPMIITYHPMWPLKKSNLSIFLPS